jgi:hypothetical protein
MIEKDLDKFWNNVQIFSKELSKYEDNKKGIVAMLPTPQLFVSCDYKNWSEPQYKQALFNREIAKDLKLNSIKITTQIDKSVKTKKDKDKGIIIDEEINGFEAWQVKNGIGIVKTFNNKEDALKLVNEINDKIMKQFI